MAITFGRLGTTTLNRGVSMIATPESKIIGPWVLIFTGGDCGSTQCTTNTQIIPENCTLYFQNNVASGNLRWDIYKNGNIVFTSNFTGETTIITTIVYNIDDTLSFRFGSNNTDGTVFVRQNNSTGRLISTFNYFTTD